MPKLSEEARKKIAEAVRKSWVARRARQANAKPASTGGRKKKLSAEARKKISDAVRRSWAGRRGRMVSGVAGPAMAAINQATRTLKGLTLQAIGGLSNHRGVTQKLKELETLASDLRRLLGNERSRV